MKALSVRELQQEQNATQVELRRMLDDERLRPELRAAIVFGAASLLASPRIHTLDLRDLDLRTR